MNAIKKQQWQRWRQQFLIIFKEQEKEPQRDIQKKNVELKPIKEIEVESKRYKRDNRLHPKTYLTIFGELQLKRYCYQPEDKTPKYNGSDNIYPVDISANLSKDKYSYTLQEIAVLATNSEAYIHGSKLIKKILNISLSVDSLERINKNSSQGYDDFYQDYKPKVVEENERVVISFDGKGIPMTKEESANIKAKNGKGEKKQKKKESLVGVCYSVKPIIRLASSLASSLIFGKVDIEEYEKVEDFQKGDMRKMASLKKSKIEVMEEMKAHIDKMNINTKPLVIMDGARGLWKNIDTVFGKDNYIGILDIIHVRDYLYTTGYVFYKEGSPQLRDWVYSSMLKVLEGEARVVLEEVKKEYEKADKNRQARLKPLITYFTNNLSRMKYDEYLKNGYPIASGAVESACSQVVANRTELPGARWTVEGVEPILKHRSIYTSDDWDEYWNYYKGWNRKKNYANNIEVVESLLLEDCELCG